MNMNLNLNTGVKPIDINFGEIGSGRIYYNPADTNFSKNLLNLQENIKKRIDELKSEDFDIDEFGNPVMSDETEFSDLSDEEKQDYLNKMQWKIDVIDKTNKIFYEEIDKVFIGNASEVIFKYCNPLALIDGEFYISQFFGKFGKEMEKVAKELKKAANEKQKKPVSKHVKKK